MSCWRPTARSCFGDYCPRTKSTASCASVATTTSRAIHSFSARESMSKARRAASVGIGAVSHTLIRRNKSWPTLLCISIAPIISLVSDPSRLHLHAAHLPLVWPLRCSLRSFRWRSRRPAPRPVIMSSRQFLHVEPRAAPSRAQLQSRSPLHRPLAAPLPRRLTTVSRTPHAAMHHLFRIHSRSRPTLKKRST